MLDAIDELDDASRRGDLPAALELALAAWRTTRAPALAEVVDALGAGIPAEALDPRDYHRAWLALAGENRAHDASTLVAGLRTKLPRPKPDGGFRVNFVRATGWIERVAALAARPDDPRMGRPLVDVIRDAPWVVHDEAREAYEAPFRLLARLRDVRLIPDLEDLASAARERRLRNMWYLVLELVAPVLDELRSVRPAEVDVARCREIVARHRSAAPPVDAARIAELYAMVYADSDDPAPRHVLADALQELGDPRGELIALQLAHETPDTRARVEALVRKHRAAWLGDLDHVLKLVVFERGFLTSAALVQNARAAAAVWERTPSDERLATVEHFAKGDGNERHYSAFVFSPQMRALRTVELLSRKMIARVCEATAPWSFETIVFDKLPTAKQVAMLAATSALPHWSHLVIRVTTVDFRALVQLVAPVAPKLNEIAVKAIGGVAGSTHRDWLAATEQLATVLCADDAGMRVRAHRENGAVVVELVLTDWSYEQLDRTVARFHALAPAMDRLVVHTPPGADRTVLAARFAAFPLVDESTTV